MENQIEIGFVAYRDKEGNFLSDKPLYAPATAELEQAKQKFEQTLFKVFAKVLIDYIENKK